MRHWLIGLFFLFICVACSRQLEPVPLRFSAAVWQPGEVSTYAVTTSRGENIGAAQITVLSEQGDTAAGWLIQRQIVVQGAQEESSVVIAQANFRPISATLLLTDSTGVQSVAARYDSGNVGIMLVSKQGLMHTEQRSIPTDSHDANTLLVLLRSLPLAAEYTTQLNLFTPLTGFLETTTLHVAGQEQMIVPAGTFDTWQVELINGEITSQVWIGTAAPFPLVKWSDGKTQATFALTEFRVGNPIQ